MPQSEQPNNQKYNPRNLNPNAYPTFDEYGKKVLGQSEQPPQQWKEDVWRHYNLMNIRAA